MVTSILRIEARRTIAPWVGLALVVVALGFLFLLTGPWWHSPAYWYSGSTTSALWIRFMLVFLWPIVVGAGAISGMRDARSGMTELLGTTPRPVWHRVAASAGVFAALAGLGYVLVLVVGLGEVAGHGGFFTAGFVPLLVVALVAIAAGGWLGLALGRLLPHPLTAPAMAVLTLVVTVVLWTTEAPGTSLNFPLPFRLGFLSPALAEPRGTFMTTTASVDIGQFTWFAGLAATAFLLLCVGSWRKRLLALLPAVVAAAVALPLLPSGVDDVLTEEAASVQPVCDGPVCVTKTHAAVLPRLAVAGREALQLLAKIPGAPTRVEESVAVVSFDRSPVRKPDAVLIDFQAHPRLLDASVEDLRRILVAGAGVPTCLSASMGGLSDEIAQTISAAWFIGDLKPLPHGMGIETDGQVSLAWERFRALPAAEQERRILALRGRLLTCPRGFDDNPLDALVPGIVS